MGIQWERLLRKLAQIGGEGTYYYQRYLDIHRNTPFSRERALVPVSKSPQAIARPSQSRGIKRVVVKNPEIVRTPSTAKALNVGMKIHKIPTKQVTRKAAKIPIKTLGKTTGKTFARSWFKAHGPAMLVGAGLGLLLSKILGD